MTKAQSKYFNTAKKMDKAFLELMEKKDFEYITITEICKKAGVNRSTFYLHYESVADLLNECVEDINNRFLLCFKKTSSEFEQNIASASLEELFLITPEYLIPYLTYVSENRTVIKVVLGNPNIMQADKTYTALIGDILNQILERHKIPEKKREYILSFYIQGIMGIVKQWLLAGCEDSVEYIAEVIMLVVRR